MRLIYTRLSDKSMAGHLQICVNLFDSNLSVFETLLPELTLSSQDQVQL